jgi:UDP-glucose 4-epimerase
MQRNIYNETKCYLVTGGCGFIGSHLVDALIEEGHDVVVLDDLSTGKRKNLHPKASLIVGDAINYKTVEKAFDGVDGCFHLAAVASVEKSIKDWAKTHAVNVTSTVNVFQAASRKKNPVPVVYTSSAAVYGNCKIMPIPEEAKENPITAYGVDKFGSDLHANVAWNVHNVPNIGLRPFNVYGPRQDPHSPYSGVISIFTDRIMRGKPITIFGDGKQVRDFVYVEDAVTAFMSAMICLKSANNSYGHDIINLCTGKPTFIAQLAETIERIAGCNMQRNYAPSRKGDIRVSIGDPSRMAARLGLRLTTSLEEGLRELIGSFGMMARAV